MSGVMDKIIKKLSPEAVEIIYKIDLRTEEDKVMEKLNNIEEEHQRSMLEFLKEQTNLRCRMVENETEMLRSLRKDLESELAYMKTLEEHLKPNLPDLQRRLDGYKERVNAISKGPRIDIAGIFEVHQELQEKKKKIMELEKKLSKYSGLPPVLAEAKLSVESMSQEVLKLENQVQGKIDDELKTMLQWRS